MKRLLPLLLLLALPGCNVIPPPQTDQTHYFVITASTPPSAGATAPGALRLRLKPVELAGYLRTPDIVVRRGPNQLDLHEFERWAEPLDAGILRALQSRLLADPGVASVTAAPFVVGAQPDYNVSVEILHCEGDGSSAQFAARVEISSASDGLVVARRVYVAPASAWNGRDFGKLAALLSDDVSALGGTILAALPHGT